MNIHFVLSHVDQDNVELGSPAGLTRPQLPKENPNSNLSQHAYNTYENPGPSVVNAPSLSQSVPSSFNAALVGEPQPYPPSMVTFFYSSVNKMLLVIYTMFKPLSLHVTRELRDRTINWNK